MIFLAELVQILGADAVVADAQRQAPYLKEWRGQFSSACQAVVLPASTEQVAAVVIACNRHGVSMVPQGGNTGLCGGAVSEAGQIILSLARLHGRCEVDAATSSITVDAGCRLAEVQDAAAEAGLYFPVSIVPREQAQIGGLIATNAGGTNVLKYGNTRQQLLGLEAVLPDGAVWNDMRALHKDNSGYDLKQLFTGSEGTLGIITAAVLRLYPQPRGKGVALAAVSSIEEAMRLLSRVRADCPDVSAAEVFSRFALELVQQHAGCAEPLAASGNWYVLLEQELFGQQPGYMLNESMRSAGIAADASVVAADEAEAGALWALRKGIPAAQTAAGQSLKHDISVPLSRIPELVARGEQIIREFLPAARPCVFGHLGDGNLHFNVSQAAQDDGELKAHEVAIRQRLYDLIEELGGSFAAEHGIGLLKTDELERYRSRTEVALMRAIKQAMDPKNLMNPGKVLGDQVAGGAGYRGS